MQWYPASKPESTPPLQLPLNDDDRALMDGMEVDLGIGSTVTPQKSPGAMRSLRKRRWEGSPQQDHDAGLGFSSQPSIPDASGATPSRHGLLPSPLGNPLLHSSAPYNPFNFGGYMGGSPTMQSLAIPPPHFNLVPLSPVTTGPSSRWVRARCDPL